MQLTETKQLHDTLGLGGNTDRTTDTDYQSQLGFGRDVKATFGLGLATVINGFLVRLGIFRIVGSGILLEFFDILLGLGSGSLIRRGLVGGDLGLSLFLLQYRFGGLHGCGLLRDCVV